jgi:hypothetical protein
VNLGPYLSTFTFHIYFTKRTPLIYYHSRYVMTTEPQSESRPFARWNDYEVDAFLDSYGEHNASLKGKELWKTIQSDMKSSGYKKSLWTLEKKWNNLLRRYHKGTTPDTFVHHGKMAAILDERRKREYRPFVVNEQGQEEPIQDPELQEHHLKEWEETVLFETENAIQEMIESYKREIRHRNDTLRKLVTELETLVKEPED